MAVVVYQETPGFLWIDGKEIPLINAVLSFIVEESRTLISIRSANGNHTWLSNANLAHITDDQDQGYATIEDFLQWWASIDKTGLTALDINVGDITVDVNIDEESDSILIYGNDGVVNNPLFVDEDGAQKTQLVSSDGKPIGAPSLVDIGDDPVFYEGYFVGAELLICKIDSSTSVITRTWAVGDWADRTTLIYE
jgi:hypothetical protein